MEFVEISKLLIYKKGKPPIKKNLGEGEELPYLTPEYLRGKNRPEIISKDLSSVVVDDGDLILLWDGSNAGEVFKAKKGILSSTMVVIESSSNFNKDFLYYVLKNKENYLKGQTSGSGIPHVDKEILGNIKVGLFEENEQTAIAEVLGKIDLAIEKTNKLIEKQKRIKQGLMQDLLTKGIDEHGNIRNEKTHRFKDSPLGRIPEEWEVRKLQDVSSQIADCPHTTPKFQKEGVIVARTSNIKEGIFDINNCSYVNEKEYLERISRATPETNDIIFTREAPVGEAFVIPKGMKICLGQRVMLIKTNAEKLNPHYFVEFVYSDFTRIRVETMLGGTTTPHFNVQDVRDFKLTIPSIEEQDRIIESLSSSKQMLESENNQLTKLGIIKQGLMQDLLTGKKSVENLISE